MPYLYLSKKADNFRDKGHVIKGLHKLAPRKRRCEMRAPRFNENSYHNIYRNIQYKAKHKRAGDYRVVEFCKGDKGNVEQSGIDRL